MRAPDPSHPSDKEPRHPSRNEGVVRADHLSEDRRQQQNKETVPKCGMGQVGKFWLIHGRKIPPLASETTQRGAVMVWWKMASTLGTLLLIVLALSPAQGVTPESAERESNTIVLEARSPASHLEPSPPQSTLCEWEEFFIAHRRTVTREDFFRCLRELVPERNMPEDFVKDHGSYAEIRHPDGRTFRLLFSPVRTLTRDSGRYWRHPSEVRPVNPSLPLSGARIAIDPGHIGGEWAAQEGRLFHGRCGTRVAEGDMNLEVARTLKEMLETSGAKVWLTRSGSEPMNGRDSSIFRERAERELRLAGRPVTKSAIQAESDRLLLQVAEIESRAKLINERIRPDMVICLHFNAEPWGSRGSPRFSSRNHLHVLIGGSYLRDELDNPENRLDLLRRAAEGTRVVESPLARSIATRLAQSTGLPPFSYGENSRVATPDPENPFVWRRNLLATRTFHCPVIYPEPFVMNNEDFVAAVASSKLSPWSRASSYSDIFAQYARGVHRGILDYWSPRNHSSAPYHRQNSPANLTSPPDPYAPAWVE